MNELNELLTQARFMDVCHKNYLTTGTGIEVYLESIQEFHNMRDTLAAEIDTKSYMGLAVSLQTIVEELERIVQSDTKDTNDLEAVYSALVEIVEHTKEPSMAEAN